jgi:hypothetical protein
MGKNPLEQEILNSSPVTYQINGRQYLITPVDSVVYAWTLPPAQ